MTTVAWPSRVQTPAVSGFEAYSGAQADDGSSATAGTPDTLLGSLTTLSCFLANGAPGTNVQITNSVQPAANTMLYFLVGHNPLTAGAQAPLGRRGDGTLRPLAPVCP